MKKSLMYSVLAGTLFYGSLMPLAPVTAAGTVTITEDDAGNVAFADKNNTIPPDTNGTAENNNVMGSNNTIKRDNDGEYASNNSITGNSNTVDGDSSTVVGNNNKTTGTNATVMGDGNTISSTDGNGIAIGQGNTITNGNASMAIGFGNKVDGNFSTATGNGAQVKGDYSSAMGEGAQATGTSATAVGAESKVNADHGTAIGVRSEVDVDGGAAVGDSAVSNRKAGSQGYLSDGDTSSAWKSTEGAFSVGNDSKGVTRQITGVAAGTADTDAVNVAQLKVVDNKVDDITNEVTNMYDQVSGMSKNIDKVGAKSAALAALHPLDYDPNNKMAFTAGVGSYKSEQSMAIGAFYRPNEDVMVSIGSTLGDKDNSYNFGVSFKFGKSSSKTIVSKDKMAQLDKDVDELKSDNAKLAEGNEKLAKDNADLQARVEKLEKAVH